MSFQVRKNEDKNGIEVLFPEGRPARLVRDRLKALGFRWSPAAQFWWRRRDGEMTVGDVQAQLEEVSSVSGGSNLRPVMIRAERMSELESAHESFPDKPFESFLDEIIERGLASIPATESKFNFQYGVPRA